MLEFVNSGQQEIGVCEGGIEPNGFTGAAFGIGDLAKRKLSHSQKIFASGGGWLQEKCMLQESLGLFELVLVIADHGEPAERRGESGSGQLDGFFEILSRGFQLAETGIGEPQVVVRPIGGGTLLDGAEEVLKAGLRLAFRKEASAFFVFTQSLGGH